MPNSAFDNSIFVAALPLSGGNGSGASSPDGKREFDRALERAGKPNPRLIEDDRTESQLPDSSTHTTSLTTDEYSARLNAHATRPQPKDNPPRSRKSTASTEGDRAPKGQALRRSATGQNDRPATRNAPALSEAKPPATTASDDAANAKDDSSPAECGASDPTSNAAAHAQNVGPPVLAIVSSDVSKANASPDPAVAISPSNRQTEPSPSGSIPKDQPEARIEVSPDNIDVIIPNDALPATTSIDLQPNATAQTTVTASPDQAASRATQVAAAPIDVPADNQPADPKATLSIEAPAISPVFVTNAYSADGAIESLASQTPVPQINGKPEPQLVRVSKVEQQFFVGTQSSNETVAASVAVNVGAAVSVSAIVTPIASSDERAQKLSTAKDDDPAKAIAATEPAANRPASIAPNQASETIRDVAANAPAQLTGNDPQGGNRIVGTGARAPENSIDQVRFIQRVARAFRAADEQGGQIRLRLSPPELGSLKVEVALRNGVMTARLEAETTSARSLLLDNLPALRERLAGQNIKIERFDVDLKQDGSPGGSANPSPDFSGSRNASQRLQLTGRNRLAPEADSITASANVSTRTGDGQINVIV